MSRELSYTAFILKKQPYGEGDEIVTAFTLEGGKLRFLAKSTKLVKSRLQHALQALFLVGITVTGASQFPKIIHAQVVEPFMRLRENLTSVKMAYYATELLIKFTADEQKNERLFNLYREFFSFLNSPMYEHAFSLGLAKFKVELLESVGFGVHYSEDFAGREDLGFSNSRGGFGAKQGVDFVSVSPVLFNQFLTLKKTSFDDITQGHAGEFQGQNIGQLQDLLSSFIRYQLERDVKSERFLEGEM